MHHNASKMSLPSVTFSGISNPASPHMEPLNMTGAQKRHDVSRHYWNNANFATLLCEATRWQHATTHILLQTHPYYFQQDSVGHMILQLLNIYLIELMHFLPSLNHLVPFIKHRYIITFLCVIEGKLKCTVKYNMKVVSVFSVCAIGYLISNPVNWSLDQITTTSSAD